MLTHGERLANLCSTQAGLTCAARVNLHEHAPGTLSLVREIKEKVGPSSIVDGLRKHPARQALDVQILDGDQAVLINNLPGFFVMKIPALIANVIVKPRQKQDRLASAIGALLSTRRTALQSSKFCLRDPEPARVFDLRPVAQRGKRIKSDVYADHVSVKGQRRRFAFDGEQGKPAPGLTFDCEGFDFPVNRSVQLDSNIANFRDPQLVTDERVADLSKRHAVVATSRAKAWIPRLLSVLHATKERVKSQMYAAQDVLQNLCVDCGDVLATRAYLFQLQVLIEPGNRFTLALPRIAAFLQSCIVELAANGKLIIQRLLLPFCWIDAVAKDLYHNPILSDRYQMLAEKRRLQ